MLFAFFCIDKPDHLEVRKENRPAHIAYLEFVRLPDTGRRADLRR